MLPTRKANSATYGFKYHSHHSSPSSVWIITHLKSSSVLSSKLFTLGIYEEDSLLKHILNIDCY